MSILDSLLENDSIQLSKKVENWQEAIKLLMKPLEISKAVTENYAKAIIDRTEEIGPFYIIGPSVAMPHERGELGALKNAFTFLTLEHPVEFPGNEMVDILVGFSATNSDEHIAESIPQVVMIFEDDSSFDDIRKIKSKEELIKYISDILN